MAPFSIPAPSIIPLRFPTFGGPRTIDTDTLIELCCETQLEHEIFYTLDGTKPQPYAGIVQGSKLYKYRRPLRLTPGKVTIKAVALSSIVHSMRSSVITKTYEVVASESGASPCKKKTKKQSCKDKEANQNDDFNSFDLRDFNRDDIYEQLDETQEEYPYVSGEEALESSNEDCSIASVQEIIKSPQTDDSYLFASARAADTLLHTNDKAFISDSTREDSSVDGNHSEGEKPNESVDKGTYCRKCEALLQHCISCDALSAISSKFCIQCGTRLLFECPHCKELNTVIASFCQSCGRKMEMANLRPQEPQIRFTDTSMMAEPQTHHASVQQSQPLDNKQTQTPSQQKNRGGGAIGNAKIRLPPHSPGRGYWRQQIDYVCNHLKSYAYNNTEFRESISEPMLSQFQSVEVVKTDDKVSITVSFSPFEIGNDDKN